MRTKNMSIRFTEEMYSRVEEEAERLGWSPSDVVTYAVCKQLGMPVDPGIDLITTLKIWVEMKWGTRNFPKDATLQIFRHIKLDPVIFDQYNKIIMGDDGQLNEQKRAYINRRIGKMVKKVLKAKVVGRSLPLDRNIELIETHALLEPIP